MPEIKLCFEQEKICEKLRLKPAYRTLKELKDLVKKEGYKVDYISTYVPRGPTTGVERKYYIRISKGDKKIWVHLYKYVGHDYYFVATLYTRQ